MLACVDRYRRFHLGGQSLDHPNHAVDLLVHRHRVRTGTSGLPSNVQEVGPVLDHLYASGDGHFGFEEPPAVGEGVGSDVDDPHHVRSGTAIDDAIPHTPLDLSVHPAIVAARPARSARSVTGGRGGPARGPRSWSGRRSGTVHARRT